jgi:hypothetical protein
MAARFIATIVIATAVSAVSIPAAAQDASRVALVVAFPSPTVSVQWELSNSFALRFDGGYSYERLSREQPDESSAIEHVYADGSVSTVTFSSAGLNVVSTSRSGTLGISGIVTLVRREELHLYAAPRVAMTWGYYEDRVTWTSPRTLFESDAPDTEIFNLSTLTPSLGTSFGVAVHLRPRLALFGEAGFDYSRTNLPADDIAVDYAAAMDHFRRTAITTRAVGGVMFRF